MGVDRPLASCKMPQTACGTPLHEAGGALGGVSIGAGGDAPDCRRQHKQLLC